MPDLIYIPQLGNIEPWLSDFRLAADGRVEMSVYDHKRPAAGQFTSIRVVVDLGGHASRKMIEAGADAGVQLWQVLGTGLDHTEVAFTRSMGIPLANTPGQLSAVPLAEHALLLILCLIKKLHEAERNACAGLMYRPVSDELAGKVLCVVGLGASGRELARRADALGMRVLAVDVTPVTAEESLACGVSEFGSIGSLDSYLSQADFVSLHVPLVESTRHMIDTRRLELMKPSAALINVARGHLVDEEALVGALRSGGIAGAGIDVFGEEPLNPSNPLLDLENAVVTPHMAGATSGTSRRRCNACVENVLRVLRGETPRYLVES
jgi:D-3-phosphoglycerate dehydrogenase